VVFKTREDLHRYVIENYPAVTDQRIDHTHWDLMCTHCKIVRGFQVLQRAIAMQESQYRKDALEQDFLAPVTYFFRCPVCGAFKIWILFEPELKEKDDGKFHKHYFRVTSIPGEGLEEIEELPPHPPALRTAYRQAVRAMDANAHLAAAAMFRRAVQVITRDILGAKPGNLANELKQVVGKSHNGATITDNFATNGYIVKEAGNQGAHPDKDPDLLDFSAQDAEDLQRVFMELVTELFVVPEAVRKAKAEFLARRKISTSP
jgi:Domain of unknown function (DUF4145)